MYLSIVGVSAWFLRGGNTTAIEVGVKEKLAGFDVGSRGGTLHANVIELGRSKTYANGQMNRSKDTSGLRERHCNTLSLLEDMTILKEPELSVSGGFLMESYLQHTGPC